MINIKKLYVPLIVIAISLIILTSKVIASDIPTISTACESKSGKITSFNDGFSLLKNCDGNSRRVILIGQQGPKGDTGPQGPQGPKGDPAPTDTYKHILDIQDVRGSSFSTTSATAVATPDKVTVNCPVSCDLLIKYYVDTRNNSNAGAPPNGFNNIYDVYVDGTDEAIFTQASNPVPNAAIPLALNGLVPAGAGTHLVQIYAYTNGGELESFESGLQVTATTP